MIMAFISIIIAVYYASPTFAQNTALLTPSTLNQNGANVSILNPNMVTVDNVNNEWDILIHSMIGWQMMVNLEPNSWGFHPNKISTLQFEVNSNVICPCNDKHLIVSFSVGSAQFITTMIAIDNGMNNKVYPGFDESITTKLGSGDILTSVNDVDNERDRICKASNNICSSCCSGLSEMNQYPSYNNEFPLIWKLTNDPIQDTVYFEFWSSSWNANATQKCAFNESFYANQGMQIYIGGDDYEETMQITSFNIIYNIIEPVTTTVPSTYPSTIYPSLSPTDSPSLHRNEMPSLIISTPTQSPTIVATMEQTEDILVSREIVEKTTGIIISHDTGSRDDGFFKISNTMFLSVIILSISVCIICCVLCVVYIYVKKKKNKCDTDGDVRVQDLKLTRINTKSHTFQSAANTGYIYNHHQNMSPSPVSPLPSYNPHLSEATVNSMSFPNTAFKFNNAFNAGDEGDDFDHIKRYKKSTMSVVSHMSDYDIAMVPIVTPNKESIGEEPVEYNDDDNDNDNDNDMVTKGNDLYGNQKEYNPNIKADEFIIDDDDDDENVNLVHKQSTPGDIHINNDGNSNTPPAPLPHISNEIMTPQ